MPSRGVHYDHEKRCELKSNTDARLQVPPLARRIKRPFTNEASYALNELTVGIKNPHAGARHLNTAWTNVRAPTDVACPLHRPRLPKARHQRRSR